MADIGPERPAEIAGISIRAAFFSADHPPLGPGELFAAVPPVLQPIPDGGAERSHHQADCNDADEFQGDLDRVGLCSLG